MEVDTVFSVRAAMDVDKMWTHREKCNDCNWRGYYSDLNKRKPTAEEFKKHGGDKNKGYICCPKCSSFNIEGYEIDDSHLQGI